jgi:hypothetical protein
MSDSCGSHGCATPAASQSPRYRRVLWAALIINLAMFGVELAGGLSSGSVSLLADAVDFFGDAANYGISLLVLGMALTWRARAALFKGLTAHSTDRGHPFQADRGQRSGRSRTPVAGVLSDAADGRPTVRHRFGTLSAMTVEQGFAGLSTRRPRRRVGNSVPKALCLCSALLGSLVHGGGGACDAWPPRWARRGRSVC